MSAELRRAQNAYLRGLVRRARSVRCPLCKARKGAFCVNVDPSPSARRGPIAGTHWERRNEAKRRGILAGRWWGRP